MTIQYSKGPGMATWQALCPMAQQGGRRLRSRVPAHSTRMHAMLPMHHRCMAGLIVQSIYYAGRIFRASSASACLQEVYALRLGLPLPPSEPLMDETLAGERNGVLADPGFAGEGESEGRAGTIIPPPPRSTNRGLSPATVGGIIAASVFVAAMSLGLALWFARAQGGRQAPDGTSSSRRSYLMGVECEKSEEGESVREFVKTALGRAAPKRKMSGHVGSTGSGVSSARSIATSSGNGRSDPAAAAGGVACPHVHPSHLPHCCSHGSVRPPCRCGSPCLGPAL